jgi:hypothetical protein
MNIWYICLKPPTRRFHSIFPSTRLPLRLAERIFYRQHLSAAHLTQGFEVDAKKPTKNDTSSLDPYIQSGTCSSCRVRSCPLQTKPPLLKDVCWWRANHATWGSNSYLHMSNMSNLGQFFCHPWMVSTWTHRYPNSIGLNWKSKYPLVN